MTEQHHQMSDAEKRAALKKPFAITSVCRGDLMGAPHSWSEESALALTDRDMARIASKMADHYHDHGGYWDTLGILAEGILEEHGITLARDTARKQEGDDGPDNDDENE